MRSQSFRWDVSQFASDFITPLDFYKITFCFIGSQITFVLFLLGSKSWPAETTHKTEVFTKILHVFRFVCFIFCHIYFVSQTTLGLHCIEYKFVRFLLRRNHQGILDGILCDQRKWCEILQVQHSVDKYCPSRASKCSRCGWSNSNRVFHMKIKFQVVLCIDLDDLYEYNDSLVDAIVQNTRRYSSLFSDVILELLPSYKERSTLAKDSLDVYIEHRLMMESRMRGTNEQRDPRNRFPPELIKRL